MSKKVSGQKKALCYYKISRVISGLGNMFALQRMRWNDMNQNNLNKSKIADRIRTLRKENNYTQEFLAENLSISVSAYRKKEYAVSSFSTEDVLALHKLYEVSCDYILLGKETDTDALWQEISCTSDAKKLSYLLKLTEYFGGAENISTVFGGMDPADADI